MNTVRLLSLATCTALMLGACSPQTHHTVQEVKGVLGLGMSAVDARLGRASSITDAGDSVWWEYIGIAMPNGTTDGSCHIVFRKGVAVDVRC